jgi:hypothetical protein
MACVSKIRKWAPALGSFLLMGPPSGGEHKLCGAFLVIPTGTLSLEAGQPTLKLRICTYNILCAEILTVDRFAFNRGKNGISGAVLSASRFSCGDKFMFCHDIGPFGLVLQVK